MVTHGVLARGIKSNPTYQWELLVLLQISVPGQFSVLEITLRITDTVPPN